MSLQQSPEHQQAGSRTEGWASRSAWLSLLTFFPSMPFSPSYLPPPLPLLLWQLLQELESIYSMYFLLLWHLLPMTLLRYSWLSWGIRELLRTPQLNLSGLLKQLLSEPTGPC